MKVPTFLLVGLVGLTPILLVALLVFVPTLSLVAWQPPTDWSSQFGPGPMFESAVSSVSATSDSLYASGYLGHPSSSVNSSNSGSFIARYDLSGHQMWLKLFGYPGDPVLVAKAENGGVIVTGFTNGQDFVRDYDSNGTQAWSSQFSSNQGLFGVFDASEGGLEVYVVGDYRPTNLLFIYELQAYDLNGRFLWNTTISHDCVDCRNLKVYASSGGTYVSSSDYSRPGLSDLQLYGSSGTLKWTRQLDCTSCSATGVSGDGTAVYVAGYVNPLDLNRIFLDKYDLAGNKVWTHQFATDYFSGNLVHMASDSAGIYLAIEGGNGGGSIVKYDSGGNQIWSLDTKLTPYAVSGGGGGVYVGGGTGGDSPGYSTGYTGSTTYAFLAAYEQSSSLILFGLNPPFSFVLATLIAGATVTAVWWLRRHYEGKPRSYSQEKGLLKSKRIPSDAHKFNSST